jgi:hypothetical protein
MLANPYYNSVLEEVFCTTAGSVYQSDVENCLYVDFGGRCIRYSLGCFLRLKVLVEKIDLSAMASNPERSSDLEIISPCACEHCYVLTLTEILAFRELLQGAKVMLELNSIIQSKLHRVAR